MPPNATQNVMNTERKAAINNMHAKIASKKIIKNAINENAAMNNIMNIHKKAAIANMKQKLASPPTSRKKFGKLPTNGGSRRNRKTRKNRHTKRRV